MSAVDENDLETLSQEVKMDMTEYVKQTKKALTRENLGNLQFIYTAKEQKNGALLLSWKKHVMEENIKVSSKSFIKILSFAIMMKNFEITLRCKHLKTLD